VVAVVDAATIAAAVAKAAGSAVGLPAADVRRELLDRAARGEGSAWASWWRTELGRQSRPLEGGWPGTLSEARIRVARRIAVELGPEFGLTSDELEEAARSANRTARAAWNESCAPERFEGID